MGSSPRRRRNLIQTCFTLFIISAQVASASTCREDTVYLQGDWGEARFSVEIADDPQERAVGLINRDSMPMSSGMLFVYERPQPLSFWMRNTLIPLDMIFVDQTGVVRHVHHEAVPLDETPIFGGRDLTHVLEINGGLSKQMGIEEGTRIKHPSFSQSEAAWPC